MSLKEVRKCGGIVMDEQLDIEFKRKTYDKILEWKEKRASDYALFLKGGQDVLVSTFFFFPSAMRQSFLSWTHYLVLLQVFSKEARDWYEKETITGTWSVRTL